MVPDVVPLTNPISAVGTPVIVITSICHVLADLAQYSPLHIYISLVPIELIIVPGDPVVALPILVNNPDIVPSSYNCCNSGLVKVIVTGTRLL